jgi:signal transduction histidine kinase
LRPSVLDDLGLHAAVEWLSDSSASRGVSCAFTCSGSPQPAPPEAEIAIFRIVQEALSNIWRHSNAAQASIELKYTPNLLQVLVCDDGQGFVLDQHNSGFDSNSHSSLGLLGMRERAALIGASLTISSSPGTGCSIFLSLPLKAN